MDYDRGKLTGTFDYGECSMYVAPGFWEDSVREEALEAYHAIAGADDFDDSIERIRARLEERADIDEAELYLEGPKLAASD